MKKKKKKERGIYAKILDISTEWTEKSKWREKTLKKKGNERRKRRIDIITWDEQQKNKKERG